MLALFGGPIDCILIFIEEHWWHVIDTRLYTYVTVYRVGCVPSASVASLWPLPLQSAPCCGERRRNVGQRHLSVSRRRPPSGPRPPGLQTVLVRPSRCRPRRLGRLRHEDGRPPPASEDALRPRFPRTLLAAMQHRESASYGRPSLSKLLIGVAGITC